ARTVTTRRGGENRAADVDAAPEQVDRPTGSGFVDVERDVRQRRRSASTEQAAPTAGQRVAIQGGAVAAERGARDRRGRGVVEATTVAARDGIDAQRIRREVERTRQVRDTAAPTGGHVVVDRDALERRDAAVPETTTGRREIRGEAGSERGRVPDERCARGIVDSAAFDRCRVHVDGDETDR